MRLAESTVEQNRERAAWADRMVKLSYMSAAQAAGRGVSRLDSSVEDLRSKRAKLIQLLNSDRDQTLTNLILTRDNAVIELEKANLQAAASLAKLEAADRKYGLLLAQVEEALHDIAQQRAECRITAPDSIEPDSMVVYYKNESNRFSTTTSGMIEQGAQVKEGQKMLRIPNLNNMQVNTKVHEAMVARVRGDVRIPTHNTEHIQTALILNPFLSQVMQNQDNFNKIRERLHKKMGVKDYVTTARGQKATIRVDALSGRTFEGHVSTVAAVASQADSWISDVKLYQTLVTIDKEVLPDGSRVDLNGEEIKPDMTAEVTITVDTAKEPVLSVPVQAIIGGAEMGAQRDVFVKTPTGYDRRQVTLGLYNEKVVEIREGLTEGDEVVLNPKVLLPPDDKTKTRDEGGKGGTKGGKGSDGDNPKGEGKGPGGGGGKKKGGGGGGPPPAMKE